MTEEKSGRIANRSSTIRVHIPDLQQQYLVRLILGLEARNQETLRQAGAKLIVLASNCAFYTALDERFGDEVTDEAIQDFIQVSLKKWLQPNALDPELAERLIMDMYEDESLIDEILLKDQLRAQNLLTYAMVYDAGLSGEAIEEFIRDVTALISSTLNETK